MAELAVITGSEENIMTDKERKIMQTFGKVIPKLTEPQKDYLLAIGEGMNIAKSGIGQESAPAAGLTNPNR